MSSIKCLLLNTTAILLKVNYIVMLCNVAVLLAICQYYWLSASNAGCRIILLVILSGSTDGWWTVMLVVGQSCWLSGSIAGYLPNCWLSVYLKVLLAIWKYCRLSCNILNILWSHQEINVELSWRTLPDSIFLQSSISLRLSFVVYRTFFFCTLTKSS